MNLKSNTKKIIHFLEKKHDKEIFSTIKLIPCYSNELFKAKKLCFGGITSSPNTEICSEKTIFSNSIAFYSLGNNEGAASLTNGFATVNVEKSYFYSYNSFYLSNVCSNGVWSTVKSNIFCTKNRDKAQQLRNIAIKSYRKSLIEQLGLPANRQSSVLGSRINQAPLDYALRISSFYFCSSALNNNESWVAKVIPSVVFFNMQIFFSLPKKNISFLPIKKLFCDFLNVNAKFSNISLKENSLCASKTAEEQFGTSYYKSIFKFSKSHLYKDKFLNSSSSKEFLLSLEHPLPVARPKLFFRNMLFKFVFRNNILGVRSTKNTFIKQQIVKSYFRGLYKNYINFPPEIVKMIFSSRMPIVTKRDFFNCDNKPLNVLKKRLKFKSLLAPTINEFYNKSNKIFNNSLVVNYFLKDLMYRRRRRFPYRKARLARYYKALWQLPDVKHLKSRKRRR